MEGGPRVSRPLTGGCVLVAALMLPKILQVLYSGEVNLEHLDLQLVSCNNIEPRTTDTVKNATGAAMARSDKWRKLCIESFLSFLLRRFEEAKAWCGVSWNTRGARFLSRN